jgi:branched-subunit amino acid transport protein AzlD
MTAKVFVILILLGIIFMLGSALRFMVTDQGKGTRVVRALSVRIGASIALIAVLYGLAAMGIIEPNKTPF